MKLEFEVQEDVIRSIVSGILITEEAGYWAQNIRMQASPFYVSVREFAADFCKGEAAILIDVPERPNGSGETTYRLDLGKLRGGMEVFLQEGDELFFSFLNERKYGFDALLQCALFGGLEFD